MTVDHSRLLANWRKWTDLAGMTRVSASLGENQVAFTSDDQSFFLRRHSGWWVVDEMDDRGKLYEATAKLSTYELAEKYLIWNWASVTRSAIGSTPLGVRLHRAGVAPYVDVLPTDRYYFVRLQASVGDAILPVSSSTVFSHVMLMPVDDLEKLVSSDIA
ncbi:hypothetical protein ACN27E_24990 [Mycobacterium sp. WMMD1722]|uniref:hypothetical protein n=1 Tax=Mycobacterium sp. WMMD1722 TaxID=3404117 RepID=UPI003BF547BF